MILRILIIFCLLSFSISLNAQQKRAYVLYNAKGKKISYNKLVKTTTNSDIVLFGEYHNNPISHWLQLELTIDAHAVKPLVLGAEMIEADNQAYLNDYLQEKINFETFDSLARLWGNYKTDYAPLIEYARENKLNFIGTNVPRRFAKLVNRNGGFEALDSITDKEKEWIAPLPIPFDPELPQYQKILTMMGNHGSPDMVKAQALKDATMSHFITQNRKEGSTFIHFNGAFHSDFFEGILWYLQQTGDEFTAITITTVEQEDIKKLEEKHIGRADFIICVDKDMTKTY